MSPQTALKRSAMLGWDLASWACAAILVELASSGSAAVADPWPSPALYVLAACPLQIVLGFLVKTYRGRYRVGTVEESVGVLASTGSVGLILAVGFAVVHPLLDGLTLLLLAPPVAVLMMVTARWAYREFRIRSRGVADDAQRCVIVGAGELGYQLVRLMQTNRPSPYKVVAFVDDDRAKGNLRLRGVPVAGTLEDLVAVAHRYEASTVVLGIGDAEPPLIRDLEKIALESGLTFKVLPQVAGPHLGAVRLSDLRDVEIGDLLGRGPVETDIDSIAGYLTARRVLITGAGGSIGAELARQVHRFLPSELVLLDRDESALHAVQLSIYGRGLLDTSDVVLADIRDPDSLRAAFEAHRPDVVFHAAALKHLPMLEQYPQEGWKTNVLGTLNVLRTAAEYRVSTFVNISTDKAADPTSVLGRTKRVAERLTAWHAENADGTYLSVRFGNVLGSRGSMLHTFLEQIDQGGPVTVTHPQVTRYFMTIPEACQLVIQAAAIGHDGEVLVLEMGRPVRILEVAQRLIARSGKQVSIVFTGLRPGEKVHEQLFGRDEVGRRPHHPLISHVSVPVLEPADLSPTDVGAGGPVTASDDVAPVPAPAPGVPSPQAAPTAREAVSGSRPTSDLRGAGDSPPILTVTTRRADR